MLQQPILSGLVPFAAEVRRSNLPFASAVKSIVYLNVDSQVRLPPIGQMPTLPDEKTSLLNVDGPIMMVKGVKDLEAVTEERTTTLFDLEVAGSPYRSSQRLARVKMSLMEEGPLPAGKTSPTTDFFQYVVLIRDGKALTKFE